ncbi:MAG: D-tyrosyl-tRNA(Tyr) deacylase [Spirochaetaceae bacterium]|nr:MAG: D-tyrosyl-tRNA(Tyr) deacylase [Spirochaetaceae bacterium]
MRAVIQRVIRAEVRSGGVSVGAIGEGLLVYLGVSEVDNDTDAGYIADKIHELRIFPDTEGRMNTSLREHPNPAALVVSQFTLYGDTRKGRRPSYNHAASAEHAEAKYLQVCTLLGSKGIRVATGKFQSLMEVESVGDGPVTILVDSHKQF